MPIRVLIVDPNEITRAGIISTFRERPALELVGAAASLDEGLRIANQSKIDVAIIDPAVVPGDNFGAVLQFQQAFPSLNLLVFCSEDCGDFARSITTAGASGYLTKAANVDEVSVAIRAVHLGRIFISHTHQTISGPKQSGFHTQKKSVATVLDGSEDHQLSVREQEVLSLLVDGMTNKQAA